MKRRANRQRGQAADMLARVLVGGLLPKSTFADMLLLVWAFLLAGMANHGLLLAQARRAAAVARANIAGGFDASAGLLDTVAAAGHALGTAAAYAWLALIAAVAVAIPLTAIIREALRPRELTFHEKKELSYTVRFFYAALGLTGTGVAAGELYGLVQAPAAGWLAAFNIALVGFVCLQRIVAVALAAVCDDGRDSWSRGFFASRIAGVPVPLPVVLAGLPAAAAVYVLASRSGSGALWAILLSYAYGGMVLQLLSAAVHKLRPPKGAAP